MNSLTTFSMPPLASALLFLFLGAFVFLKNRKFPVNISFSLVCLTTFWWQFSWFILFNTQDEAFADIIVKIGYAGIILIPIAFFRFFISFLEKETKTDKILFYASCVFALIFELSLFFSDYFVKGFYDYYWGFYPKVGILHPFYLLNLTVLLARIIYLLITSLRKKGEILPYKYSQLKYLLWAMILYALASVDFLTNYGFEIYPIGFIFILIFLGIIGYTIVRYRLMDIRIVLRKIFIYLGLAIFSYIVFFTLVWLFERYFGGVFVSSAYLSGLIIAPVFILLIYALDKSLKIIANKHFFVSLYNYQETITKLTDELTYSIDLSKIIDSIVGTIKQTMQLNRAGVLLIDQDKKPTHYQIAKVVGFNEQNGISLVEDSILTNHLSKTQKPLVRDELLLLSRDAKSKDKKQSFNRLYEHMKHIEASLCLPLISGNKLIGIIVLGAKISKDAYTTEDLDLLSTLSKQAAIAIENARSYKEIQNFNATLKQKVDDQTKKIRQSKEEVEKAYEVEQKANEELKKLDTTKSQFMLATQHHLRTPLTSMQGYLDLLIGGTYGKIPKRAKEALRKLQFSTKNEIKIVNELLDISQFQLGRKVVALIDDVDIEKILNETIESVKPEAKTKGLYLEMEESCELPKIKADNQKLKVALFNIIDNAIKYTQKGGVTIKCDVSDNKLHIIIIDTGLGIEKEKIGDIFNKIFERGKEAEKMFTTGRGIGLYISYRIIKDHNGNLKVESQGKGKGSSFIVDLPI